MQALGDGARDVTRRLDPISPDTAGLHTGNIATTEQYIHTYILHERVHYMFVGHRVSLRD